MFIIDQMVQNCSVELNPEMLDFITEVAANTTPITSVYNTGIVSQYFAEVIQWNDVLNCLLFV